MSKSSKDKIIESATDLFHKKGFLNTSIDDILETAGVTKSNLYYHFKSKEELGLSILENRIRDYETHFLSEILERRDSSPKLRLKKYYRKIIFQYEKDYKYGCPFGNLALELGNINEPFRTRLSQFFDRWEKAIENCLKDGIKQKKFRKDISPRAISGIMLSHLEGAIMMTKTHRSTRVLNSGIRAIMKLISSDR